MAENEKNYLGPITNITDNGKAYYISLENISAIQDKIGEILNSLAAKEAEDATKNDNEKHAIYTVEAKKQLETLYSSLIGSSESPDSKVVDTLKEVLDLLRNFPESQDLKKLLDEINNTINNTINTINNLDLAAVGSNGGYIKTVEQSDGRVSATRQPFDTSVSSNSTDDNAPTSRAVNTAITSAANQALTEAKEYTDTNSVNEEGVLNIIQNNSEQVGSIDLEEVSELSIGTSTNFNGANDEQIPTSKAVRQEIDNKASNYYNKVEIDNKFSNYYNKAEVDNKFSNYYNKAEVEAMIDQKINVSINDILSEEY